MLNTRSNIHRAIAVLLLTFALSSSSVSARVRPVLVRLPPAGERAC